MINRRNNKRKFSMKNAMMAATAFALGVSYTGYSENTLLTPDMQTIISGTDYQNHTPDNNDKDNKNNK